MIREITLPPAEAYTRKVWLRGVAAYMAALIASATIVGALVGFIGSVFTTMVLSNVGTPGLWTATIAVMALVYGLRELAIIRLPMPQVAWQVPASWSRYGKAGQSLLYGLVLGAGIFTFIPYASFYILLLLEASLGVVGGAALGLVYGLARALSMLATVPYAKGQGWDSNFLALRILRARHLPHVANGLALLTVSELLLGALLVAKY